MVNALLACLSDHWRFEQGLFALDHKLVMAHTAFGEFVFVELLGVWLGAIAG